MMKALIVEKERRTAPIIEEAGFNFSYTEAHDASLAEEMINTGVYQMIILDCAIPGLRCLPLLKRIRRKGVPGELNIEEVSDGIYIIIIRCPDDEVAGKAYLNAGADEVLSGPVVRRHEIIKSIKTAGRILTLADSLSRAYMRIANLEETAAIGRLLPGIAHEINNPLGFVSSNLSVLTDYCRKLSVQIHRNRDYALKGPLPSPEPVDSQAGLDNMISDIPPLLEECREGLDRIKTLIRDIQQVLNDYSNRPVDIDINACLDTTLNVIWNELKYKAKVNKSYGNLSAVHGHSDQLHQVFLTLLLRAALAIKENGRIDITTSNGSGYVSVRIAGGGDVENCPHVPDDDDSCLAATDPWRAADYGVQTARAIVRDHKGILEKETTAENAGTVFIVRLPAKHS